MAEVVDWMNMRLVRCGHALHRFSMEPRYRYKALDGKEYPGQIKNKCAYCENEITNVLGVWMTDEERAKK
jgi:hypothetical protein